MKYSFSGLIKFVHNALAMSAVALFLGLPQAGCASEKQSAQASQPPAMQASFERIDTNNDGKIILEEFRAAFPNMNEKAFVVIDKNGDNGIERAEWYEFMENHGKSPMNQTQRRGAPMNNIPGDPLIPPPDSNDLPLVRPPMN